jgi:hypothetical protein
MKMKTVIMSCLLFMLTLVVSAAYVDTSPTGFVEDGYSLSAVEHSQDVANISIIDFEVNAVGEITTSFTYLEKSNFVFSDSGKDLRAGLYVPWSVGVNDHSATNRNYIPRNDHKKLRFAWRFTRKARDGLTYYATVSTRPDEEFKPS